MVKLKRIPKDWVFIPDKSSKNMTNFITEKDLKGLSPEARVSKMIKVAKAKTGGDRIKKKEEAILFRSKFWE